MYSRKLIEYLPEFLRDIREYDAILTLAIEPKVIDLFQGTEGAMNEQFIDTASEYGVVRWERMLGIVPKSGQTLENRKFTIKTRINEQPPYTLRALKQKIEALCEDKDDYSVEVDVDKFILKVRIALTSRSAYNDVCELVERIAPMNLILDISLMYNQHKMYNNIYTHGQLTAYTHHELRERVFNNG